MLELQACLSMPGKGKHHLKIDRFAIKPGFKASVEKPAALG
jgi:hypothetical protein